jgi:hypothetical protein
MLLCGARAQRAARVAALLAAGLGGGCAPASERDRAASWLWAQQARDGAWHSATYAVLRSGQALTPFVLHALLAHGPAADERGPEIERALGWLRAQVDADGALGYRDEELLEYPVYATALAILVLVRAGQPEDRARVAAMAAWLARQQCAEPRGFTEDAPAYGAFGFGARGLAPGEPGHVDLTHTRLATQALAAAGRLDDATGTRILVLLGRLQRGDGGFFYSPVAHAANKAGRDADGAFRSYATATCEGLLTLRALGLGENDPRVAAAQRWLARHASATRIGGIPDDSVEPWHEALRFYHASVLAEAWPPARAALRAMLAGRQANDGSFRSALVTAMKEDDPLLATALALVALGAEDAPRSR